MDKKEIIFILKVTALSKSSQGEKLIIFISSNFCIDINSHFPHFFLYKEWEFVWEKGLESQWANKQCVQVFFVQSDSATSASIGLHKKSLRNIQRTRGCVFLKQSVKHLVFHNLRGLAEKSALLVSSENTRGKMSGHFLPQTLQTHKKI